MDFHKNRYGFLGGMMFVAILAGSVWYLFFRVTNEIGPIGADKSGRQVMIQTMDIMYNKLHPGTKVTSDFHDYFLLSRIFQEPMRTTLRMVVPSDSVQPDLGQQRRFLDSPSHGLLVMYCRGYLNLLIAGECSDITIRDNRKMTIEEVRTQLSNLGGKSIEDLLAAWGFRRFEVYHGSELFAGYDLKILGRGNVRHVGGD